MTERALEQSPESLFVAQDHTPNSFTRFSPTTVSSGPYAGLHSAKKRVRESVDLEASFDSAEAIAKKKAAVHETVDPKENSRASFGPAKKVAKKGGALKNV